MKRLLPIVAVSLFSTSFNALCSEAEGISPVFKTVWRASSGQKPNEAEPPWQLSGANAIKVAKGSDELKGDVLFFDTPKKETIDGISISSRTYIITNPRFWNPVKPPGGSTIEFRMKVESVAPGCANATVVGFSTGTLSFRLAFDTAGIVTGQKEYIDVDTTEMHTYRITFEENASAASLYVDNADEPIATLAGVASTTPAAVFFGSLYEASGGTSAWEYVALTNDGAYTPE